MNPRRLLNGRTHFASVGTGATSVIGPIPQGVIMVRIHASGKCYVAIGDSEVNAVATGTPRSYLIKADENLEVPVPQSTRYLGFRSHTGTIEVHVSELGEPVL